VTIKDKYRYSERDKFVSLLAKQDFHEVMAAVKGEAFREYRRQWDCAGRFELETPVPLHCDFEFSTGCNLRCSMCPHGMPRQARPAGFDRVSGRFPFELFRKVIDEGVPLGLRAIDLSYYNEPLLRDDLPEFIEYAGSHGILDILCSTNAQLLDAEWTERLLDTPLTRLKVSLDADSSETYAAIRSGGDFGAAVGNLERFIRRKAERGQVLPITRVSFVKTRLNEHELDGFLARWTGLADYVCVQELIEFDEMKVDLTPASRIVNRDFRCHHPWHQLTFRVDGQALPCCTIWGQQIPVGNVAEQSLAEIWTGPAMKALRRLHREGRYQENPVCHKCAKSSVAGQGD